MRITTINFCGETLGSFEHASASPDASAFHFVTQKPHDIVWEYIQTPNNGRVLIASRGEEWAAKDLPD